jgi:hypothetical protein
MSRSYTTTCWLSSAQANVSSACALPAPKAKAEPAARPQGKRAEVLAAAETGKLPPKPDFSAPTHKRFRAKLDALHAFVKAADIKGLKAFEINPVSSSPKALARYRELAIIALKARSRERPEFSGFVNNNTDTNVEPNVTSLGVRVKIPFAYDAVNEPKRAAAAAEVIAAHEELELAEREVGGDVAQANARLDGARQQLAALEARRTALGSVVDLTQSAQRAGQSELNDLIRARLQLFAADLSRVTARVAVERARSDINQAPGDRAITK